LIIGTVALPLVAFLTFRSGYPAQPMTLLSCPACRFAFRPRTSFLTLDFCPRCLAKRGVADDLVRVDDPIRDDPALDRSAVNSEWTSVQRPIA